MTSDQISPNRAMRRVLAVLLAEAGNVGGYTVSRMTGLGAGSAYLALAKIERSGWVTDAGSRPWTCSGSPKGGCPGEHSRV